MSSLKDSASLIMIPSLYKDGRLDTIKPLGNSILHPDATGSYDGTDGSTPPEGNFTFSRGSDISATRVNSSGLIEKARVSLFSYNTDFTNVAWTNQATTIVANQIANPVNGAVDADLFYPNASGTYKAIIRFLPSASTTYVGFSIYAKAGGKNILYFNDAPGNRQVAFDLSAGTFVNTSATAISMDSLGNGWYRCAFSVLTEMFYMCVSDGTGSSSVTANGTDGIYIWGQQTEYGIPTDFLGVTTTTAVVEGLTADMPRLDYSGGASCPSLLLEPQRSNFIPHSEYISSSAGWTITDFGSGAGAPVVTLNAAMSPEGKMNACQIDFQSCTGAQQSSVAYTASGFSVGDMITHSVYLKAPVDCTLIIRDASTFNEEPINVTTEWQRFDVTAASGFTYSQFKIALRPSQGSQSDACSVYMYAPQIELGSYPTSYIPTYGTSQTRSNDSCLATSVSDLIGQTQGTIFVDVPSLAEQTNGYVLECSDGSNANRIIIQRDSTNDYRIYVQSSAGVQLNNAFGGTFNSRAKIAFAYADNDYNVYVNGLSYLSGTSFSVPNCNQINIGERYNNTTQLGGKVSQTLLFPTRLTNAELAALTTI